MTAPSRLPLDVKRALGEIVSVTLAFDRVTFWIDNPAPVLPSKRELKADCSRIKIRKNKSRRYHSLWQTEVALFQPGRKALQMIENALITGRYRSKVEYAEIAIDFITRDVDDANAVKDFFLGHVVIKHFRDQVYKERDTTWYYRPRGTSDGKKHKCNFVIYADKPSKLAGKSKGAACCHIEYRFTGSEALAAIGINCLADVTSFQHASFWQDNMKLMQLPSKKVIAELLSPDKLRRSDVAKIKQANKFLQKAEISGTFVAQNLRHQHRGIVDKLLIDLDANLFLFAGGKHQRNPNQKS